MILNINSLDEIPFVTEVEITEDYSFEIDTTINFYALSAVIILICIVVVVLGLTILGSGFNDFGTKTIAKYIFYAIILIFFQLSIVYFIYPFGIFGVIVNLFMGIIYFLNILESIHSE